MFRIYVSYIKYILIAFLQKQKKVFLQTLLKGNNILPLRSRKSIHFEWRCTEREIIHSKGLQCKTINDTYFHRKPDSTKIFKYHQYYCMLLSWISLSLPTYNRQKSSVIIPPREWVASGTKISLISALFPLIFHNPWSYTQFSGNFLYFGQPFAPLKSLNTLLFLFFSLQLPCVSPCSRIGLASRIG